ncbi:hypothetical protein GCM10022243_21290 [Saccharothrix violaceirubra]|uniref:Protein-glutamine gamma-glutamyltransferase-like C-terminal domain-containing protein n=1 Tax=Saccharothrix violaceirubra TaxID=413306 RepID=A0A7W7T8M3_9PSEU|nr:DUF4129 domain-containing protein [Saccharothrix violaceirubra]MBB4968530.1 hypothetical protein [Saccharothrix violaceirubra]
MKSRLLVAGTALLLVAIAARGTSPVRYAQPPPVDDTAVEVPPSLEVEAVPDYGAGPVGASLVLVYGVLSLAAVVAFVALLWTLFGRRKRRPRGRDVVPVTDADAVDGPPSEVFVDGARAALHELRAREGGPPGDAVVAAWLRLERAAADSGVTRLDHQTSTEFTGSLLDRYRVDESATAALRGAYQRARFGTGEVTEADARTATTALATIVRDLG